MSVALLYVIPFVEDVKEALDFYEKAFGLERRMLNGNGDYGELDTGATTLSFVSRKFMTSPGKTPAPPAAGYPTFEIAFETDDVAAAFARAVRAGATPVQLPERMPWGQTTAYVTDRDGYLVELCHTDAP